MSLSSASPNHSPSLWSYPGPSTPPPGGEASDQGRSRTASTQTTYACAVTTLHRRPVSLSCWCRREGGTGPRVSEGHGKVFSLPPPPSSSSRWLCSLLLVSRRAPTPRLSSTREPLPQTTVAVAVAVASLTGVVRAGRSGTSPLPPCTEWSLPPTGGWVHGRPSLDVSFCSLVSCHGIGCLSIPTRAVPTPMMFSPLSTALANAPAGAGAHGVDRRIRRKGRHGK